MPDRRAPDPIERILVVAPTPFFGDRGCHVRIYEEVRALERLGLTLEIVTYPDGNDVPGVVIHRARHLPGVKARALGPGYARPLLDLGLWAASRRLVRRFKPQILHVHLHEGIAIGTALRRHFGIPMVADLQGSLTAELIDHRFLSKGTATTSVVERLERWLVTRPDALVVSSATGVRLLTAQGANPGRIECLPDGVDLKTFRPLPPDDSLRGDLGLIGKDVVVFLGVLTEYQGVDALLDAVPAVVRSNPKAHFLVMGYPNEERYRARVQSMGLQAHVTLPGRIAYEHAARYLSLGLVAVSAKQSLTEANGKLLNYMACGLPVVATDTPVNREILGDAGVFTTVGDTRALADAIGALLSDEARRRDLSARLLRRVSDKFSWPALAERLVALYQHVGGAPPVEAHAAER